MMETSFCSSLIFPFRIGVEDMPLNNAAKSRKYRPKSYTKVCPKAYFHGFQNQW